MLKQTLIIGIAVLLLACVAGAHAQVGTLDKVLGDHVLAEGTVELESEDRTRTPVQHALVDVYSLERGTHWSVRTDRKGHYQLNLAPMDSYLMVVSGPGLMPLWDNNLHLDFSSLVNFVTYPGIGNRLSRADIDKIRARNASRKVSALPGAGYTVMLSEQERAEYFRSLNDHASAVRMLRDLQAESDAARTSYDAAVWLKIGREFKRSLDEFGNLLAKYSESNDEYFAKLARDCLVNMAEAHYLWALDLYDKGYIEQAKEQFVDAIDFSNRYLDRVSKISTPDPESRSFALISRKIVAQSSLDLVKFLHLVEFKKTALEAEDQAAAIDKADTGFFWPLLKARTLAAAGEQEAAIAVYKGVISSDPSNADALYEASLLLLKSDSPQGIQDAKVYLKKFITVASSADDRLEAAKQAVKSLESDAQ
jgi:tetratricopeptide (TPR) repeat protein